MRSFTSLGLVFAVVTTACSGGSGGASEEPVVDSAVEVATDTSETTDTSIDDATDAADVGDGFVPCKGDVDCASSADGKACDLATGACVPCTSGSDLCPASEHCEANKCVSGCKSDDGCASSGGDAGTDADADAEGGDAATTTKTKCDVAKHTCEECVTDEHCAPGFLCVGNVCNAGCSTTKPCSTGETCCTGACVNTESNIDNCGACGTKCSVTSGAPKCEAGACKVASCSGTLADCDGDYGNGCETDTATTVANCGACGTTCPSRPNSTSTCSSGTCGFTCNAGFADCDGSAENGCEVALGTSVEHCGACGNACSYANGTSACVSGACSLAACNTGFGDCDSTASNGCETDLLSTSTHCGSCGTVCNVASGSGKCVAGACAIDVCLPGFANCDGVAATGCETNTANDVNHCGACNAKCVTINGTAGCTAGTCTVASCNPGFRDCNTNPSDGCETNINADVNNCGGCGTVCSVANGTAGCTGGACAVAACTGTFRNCNALASDGCEVNTANDANNCGACGAVCPAGVLCNASACFVPTSCQALRTAVPTAPSGKYRIDPDGAGPIAAFDVYCEMIGAEGWTLALKANGAATTFAYSSAHWTTNSTLNTASTDLSLTEAKFNAFNTMPFTQLRLGMREGTTDRYITVNTTEVGSLLSRFTTSGFVATTASRATWLTLIGTPRLQANCNREGTNNAVGTYASVRIGILANQEADCSSPDSFIGYGAGPVQCLGGSTPLTVGNVGSCAALPSDGSTTTWGFVFIR